MKYVHILWAQGLCLPIDLNYPVDIRGSATGGARGGEGPHGFQEREKLKDFVFSCVGVIEISFSYILNKEIHALRALLLRFNTKKVSTSGGKRDCPLDPQGIFAPWRCPGEH